MRVLLTIISCILLVSFGPREEIQDFFDRITTCELPHSADSDNHFTSKSIDEDVSLWVADGYIYGVLNNELDGLCTYLRSLSVRIQFRFQSKILYIRKLSGSLLKHLIVQDNCISPHFSARKLYGWRYAVDCYVFALRHILI